MTASCSLLAVSLPTDAEDWITTKRRHLYGNPQGNIGGALPGLPYGRHHDLSYAVVARAPIQEIEQLRKQMGWDFTWVSSFNNDFNFDFNVSFTDAQLAAGRGFDVWARRGAISRRVRLSRRNTQRP
jgi:hypothetical protein